MLYEYWELFRDAEDKAVYEIISPLYKFDGKRVVMKNTFGGMVMKEIGTYHDSDSDTLVTPYGAITGAKFKKIKEFDEVDFKAAIQEIMDGKDVYIYEIRILEGLLVSIRIPFFSTLRVFDLEDLVNKTYFIKNTLQY